MLTQPSTRIRIMPVRFAFQPDFPRWLRLSIKAIYPLNQPQKKVIKQYEKQAPGELAHIDITKISKDIRCSFKVKERYVAA